MVSVPFAVQPTQVGLIFALTIAINTGMFVASFVITVTPLLENSTMIQQQFNEQSTISTAFESPHQQAMLTPPKPPTPEAVQRAQFVDKTYKWTGK
jgi:hypothetical protein